MSCSVYSVLMKLSAQGIVPSVSFAAHDLPDWMTKQIEGASEFFTVILYTFLFVILHSWHIIIPISPKAIFSPFVGRLYHKMGFLQNWISNIEKLF